MWEYGNEEAPKCPQPASPQSSRLQKKRQSRQSKRQNFCIFKGKRIVGKRKRYEWSRMQGTLVQSCILFWISSTFYSLHFDLLEELKQIESFSCLFMVSFLYICNIMWGSSKILKNGKAVHDSMLYALCYILFIFCLFSCLNPALSSPLFFLILVFHRLEFI